MKTEYDPTPQGDSYEDFMSVGDYDMQEEEDRQEYMSDTYERESEELQNYDYVY